MLCELANRTAFDLIADLTFLGLGLNQRGIVSSEHGSFSFHNLDRYLFEIFPIAKVIVSANLTFTIPDGRGIC